MYGSRREGVVKAGAVLERESLAAEFSAISLTARAVRNTVPACWGAAWMGVQMLDDDIRRGRAVWIPAAALAGAAAGFIVGWLVFGRGPPSRPGIDRATAFVSPTEPPTEPVDLRAEIGRLSDGLESLSQSVEHLAASQSELVAAGKQAVAQRPRTPARPEPAPPRIAPGVKFHDTFETGTEGWFVARFVPAIIGEVARTEEEGMAKEGRGALALSYTLEPGKAPYTVRMSGPINRLSLWIRTLNRPADVIVGVQERDDSDYNTMLHIEPDEGWRHLDFDLAQLTLGDDSTDENGRLDFHQIRSVIVADAAGFMGGEGENVLLMDEVKGEYRAEGPPAPAGKAEHF